MATEHSEVSLLNAGSNNESLRQGAAEPRTACRPQTSNKAPPIIHRLTRLTARGQPAFVAAALFLYVSVFLLSRLEAQRRQAQLGYCNRNTIEFVDLQSPTSGHRQPHLQASTQVSWQDLSMALPLASALQRQRIAQQIREAIELFRYHCRSMQLFSSDFQALVMVANAAGILMVGIVVWLSRQAGKENLHWPLPFILTSACSFALALSTMQTFNLQKNMLNSRSLAQQSSGIARGYATSIANQAFQEGASVQGLNSSAGLAQFLELMDNRLSLVDRSEFAISDQLDVKEARLFYQRIMPAPK